MKVLLCTPYNINPSVVQGGIAIWAQNIMDYYGTLKSDVQIKVVPYDRKVRKNVGKGTFKRVCNGISDYKGAIQETRKRLKEDKYDVLHLCTSASISLSKDIVVLKMAKRKGVRSVVHFHFGRIPELARQGRWEWKLLQRVVKLADVAVAMDMKSFSALQEVGYSNVCYLPNPLSKGIMQQISDEATVANREENAVSFVGHVIPTKGVYELVEACRSIKNINLHILGKVAPDVRAKMEQIAGQGSWLVFEGEVDHHLVIRRMLTTSIFVLPSYTEGFPNVILESMACGCAIVTTPVGAIPEMLNIYSDEPCGLCCEPRDVEGLRSNVQWYLDHPQEARQYAERAVKRVNEMYAVEKVWSQLVGVWRGEVN